MADQGLISETACAVIDKLNSGEVTPLDLLDVLEKRIGEVDGKVNALPTLCFDRARTHAKALMQKPAGSRGPLAGMPIPIKDLFNVKGVLNTQGSPIFKDAISAQSDLFVEHLEHHGGVVYAKSNTPEFGAGANTFNEVFGATLNPWDTSRSAAGSSGGAAVALATGMAWLAHGTDMGGSLRNPASFCGIVGMRPSIGRIAHTPSATIDRNLPVHGPMARNVRDLALLLDAMSGEHAADPLSLPKLPTSFLSAARSGERPKRVAYSPDLGITPVDPEVAAITRKAAERFAEAAAPIPLHSYWDTIVVQRLGRNPGAAAAQLIARFGNRRAEWMRGTAEDWARESFAIAKSVAYNLPASGGPGEHDRASGSQKPVFHLDAAYEVKANAAAAEQLAKGGMRLAMLLNAALK